MTEISCVDGKRKGGFNMVNITIGNNWGSIYTEALKRAGINFLLEIDGDTKLTFADEDFKRAEAIMTEARKMPYMNFQRG